MLPIHIQQRVLSDASVTFVTGHDPSLTELPVLRLPGLLRLRYGHSTSPISALVFLRNLASLLPEKLESESPDNRWVEPMSSPDWSQVRSPILRPTMPKPRGFKRDVPLLPSRGIGE